MKAKHLVFPHQTPPHSSETKIRSLHAETRHGKEDDVPYISTIRERIERSQMTLITPNLFDILSEKDCLPDDKKCLACLNHRMGGNCRRSKSFVNAIARLFVTNLVQRSSLRKNPPFDHQGSLVILLGWFPRSFTRLGSRMSLLNHITYPHMISIIESFMNPIGMIYI